MVHVLPPEWNRREDRFVSPAQVKRPAYGSAAARQALLGGSAPQTGWQRIADAPAQGSAAFGLVRVNVIVCFTTRIIVAKSLADHRRRTTIQCGRGRIAVAAVGEVTCPLVLA